MEIYLYWPNSSKEASQPTDWKTYKKSEIIWIECKNVPGMPPKNFREISHQEPKIWTSWVSGYPPKDGRTHGHSLTLSWHPPRGSTLGEAVFVRSSVRTSVCSYPLTLFVYISGSEWDISLKFFGDIPGKFVDYFWIIPNILYVCQSVSWLSSLLT